MKSSTTLVLALAPARIFQLKVAGAAIPGTITGRNRGRLHHPPCGR
jgi:hypothetical protein